MGVEKIAEALSAQNEVSDDNLGDDNQDLIQDEEQQELDLSPVERRAWDQGWRPQDQFDGNPDNWKSADAYILYGEMQEEIRSVKAESRRKEAEFDSRIANLNKLHDAQKAAAIADLKAQQREAVEDADSDRYDKLQTQIDRHEASAPKESQQPAKDPVISEWEARNPWINDVGSEKEQQAQAFWAVAGNRPGATTQSALDYVDQQMARLYPEMQPTNPRREMPTMTEQSRRPAARQRSGRELTMNDLTSQERREYEQFGKMMFKTEKEFLNSVKDSRKA